jgi:(R,R)-butanediol dehydrogenase/meso-butanediol dehydrogenase/diacetyl reductase
LKAARWYAPRDIRIEEIPEPMPGKGEVKIKVHWCGICGSDLHEYSAGPIFIPLGTMHPLTHEQAPVVLGHEYSGEVVELGAGVSRFRVGDRVVVEPIIACGECENCKAGMYNICTSLGFQGLAGKGGGLAEYATFPAEFVHGLPDELSYEEGALVEPIAVAVHSVRRSRLKEGDTAIVFGSGPIGLGTIQAARAAGASQVFAVEISETRKEYASRFGANAVLDPKKVNVVEEVQNLTGGNGVDVAFETVGMQTTFIDALNCLRATGQLVVTSIWEKEISFNPNLVVLSEKEVIGTIAYRHIFPATMQLMADGRISTQGWITEKIKLQDLTQQGFEELLKNKDRHVKILVEPC